MAELSANRQRIASSRIIKKPIIIGRVVTVHNIGNNLLENPVRVDEYKGVVIGIAFIPDRKLPASGSDVGSIMHWDVGTVSCTRELFPEHHENIIDVDFVVNKNKLVIVGGKGNIVVRTFDPLSLER